MILKFEATQYLNDRLRSGLPSASANAAETVKEEIVTVACSFTNGHVSDLEVERRTGILLLFFG